MAFGKIQFLLDARQKDGGSLREHLTAGYRASKGLTLEQAFMQGMELTGEFPELPVLTRHVWEWFCGLSCERGGNGYGANGVTSTGITAWCMLNRVSLEQWELRAIQKLDHEYLAQVNKKND